MSQAQRPLFHSTLLANAGLSLQAAIDLHDLPHDLYQQLLQAFPHANRYQQLLLIGNAGPRFWQAANDELQGTPQGDFLDDFSVKMLRRFFENETRTTDYVIVYPGQFSINLQSLGQLVGWHTQSPLMIGIHSEYGLWSAYRLLVLANTNFASQVLVDSSKNTEQQGRTTTTCARCQTKDCVQACLAQAIDTQGFHLQTCLVYRQQENSQCQTRCVAREACPVGQQHRYTSEQITYHYTQSLRIPLIVQSGEAADPKSSKV